MKSLATAVCFWLTTFALSAQTDVTSTYVKNAGFEDGVTNWTSENFVAQSNDIFTEKEGTFYLEKWTDRGSAVGSASVSQQLTGLPAGSYTLTVAAQNIQQESATVAQSGAYIFAADKKTVVTATGDYSVTFIVVDGKVTIGFKAVGATGNWLSCDNFRLVYNGEAVDEVWAEFETLIQKAKTSVGKKMGNAQALALNAAISTAETTLQDKTFSDVPQHASALNEAREAADASVLEYETLQSAIDEALELYDETMAGAENLDTAIKDAQTVVNNLDASSEELEGKVVALEKASLKFHLDNATGTAPTVVTDTRYARGSSVIFGRSTVSGVATSNILEQGFCWSTHSQPTVLDDRTTNFLTNNGNIYRMEGLTPSTVYYVRAYAMTKNYAVGYGDVIKVITLPRGTITWWYNNGADAAANARINSAVASAVEYWNTYTSIKGLHLSVSFGSGTPTADCGYGGSMRVGPNASYQRTGTIMHEMGHAIGVGQHSIWYGPNSPLRETGSGGKWLGDRATAVLRFWDNSTTSTMNGDGTHMWPYGVNGAHEDTGSEVLYIGNSLITQALGEDGLPPTGGFATPAYVFEQDDAVKYYIKSESDDFGANTAYLTINANGQLIWSEMSGADAKSNDSVAWNITFNPRTSYYIIKNVATGRLMTYYGTGRNGFRTAAKSTATTAEQFQLMRSRVDKVIGQGTVKKSVRGYWIIHPESVLNPTCFVPMASNRTETATFDFSNTAEAQRWLILSEDEVESFDDAAKVALNSELSDLIVQVREMAKTPHKEEVEGTDNALESQLLDIEVRAAVEGITTTQLSALIAEVQTAALDFLAEATPIDGTNPFDLTFFMADPSFTDAAGWSAVPTISNSCGEYYQVSFNLNQSIKNMPAGTYQFKGQAFQRPGTSSDVYKAYVAGTDNISAELYAGSQSVKIKNIMDDAQTVKQHTEDTSVGSNPALYIPGTMASASKYFSKGLYDNGVFTELAADGRTLRLGIRSTVSDASYWCIFDNFRLYFYGTMTKDIIDGVQDVIVDKAGLGTDGRPASIYTVSGVRIKEGVKNINSLPKGIYILNGKKIMVK